MTAIADIPAVSLHRTPAEEIRWLRHQLVAVAIARDSLKEEIDRWRFGERQKERQLKIDAIIAENAALRDRVRSLEQQQARAVGQAPVPPGPVPPIADMIDVSRHTFGASVEDFFGHSRGDYVVASRRLAAHLMRELRGMSYPEIADALGRGASAHSTTHAMCRYVEQHMDDPAPNGHTWREVIERAKQGIEG